MTYPEKHFELRLVQALCEREGRVEKKGSERRDKEEEDFSLLECPAQHFSLGQEVLDTLFLIIASLWRYNPRSLDHTFPQG